MEFFDKTFYGNTLREWAVGIGITLIAVTALRIVVSVLVKRLSTLTQRTQTEWDDLIIHAISRTKWFFLFVLSVHIGSVALALPGGVRKGLAAVTVLAALMQAGIWAGSALRFWIGNYRKVNLEKDRSGTTTISALGFVGQIVIWSAVLLLSLDNLGVDVTALIAGLGVGGVAVALALQKILGDLFASLAIVLDKPFVLGDFIIVDNYLGSIENIGLKTTRVRSLSGE
ncbi:MAG: mechanosensitive ion channel family protein, partial [Gemmatimonadales bacterium]